MRFGWLIGRWARDASVAPAGDGVAACGGAPGVPARLGLRLPGSDGALAAAHAVVEPRDVRARRRRPPARDAGAICRTGSCQISIRARYYRTRCLDPARIRPPSTTSRCTVVTARAALPCCARLWQWVAGGGQDVREGSCSPGPAPRPNPPARNALASPRPRGHQVTIARPARAHAL